MTRSQKRRGESQEATFFSPHLPTPLPSHGSEVVIQVQGLIKHYGKSVALDGIDFTVNKGEIFGLIGPDGAGKTTTFQVLAGVMEATAGSVQVLDQLPRNARLSMGYLTQRFSLYLDLSIDENLRYSAGLREVPHHLFLQRRAKYLQLMNLEQFGNRLAGQLSGGMKQKLALCCALISQPQILLLDEPTTGVDPVSRREFWDVLATLAARGMTVVVATPYLDEAERCHQVALMHAGQIQQIGTPTSLQTGLGWQRFEVRTSKLATAERILLKAASASEPSQAIVDVHTFGDRLDVLVKDASLGETQIRKLLSRSHLQLDTIHIAQPTLENVFVTHLRKLGSEPAVIPFPRVYQAPDQERGVELPDIHAEHFDSEVAIYTQNLWKVFGSFQAVKDVNLKVHYGEIYGLLGAN
ncbi:MAG: ATP-binding cassette domain-containing protein, partial [Chroococcidiopsidaceae cyanobacterium CP_BM_RX_35]|nr:ATP-binding cassette domain-containing protein [Chroococcidiopsidaceae cyanobacterium CP_BM_RX_35]